jgi:hypothetical protein
MCSPPANTTSGDGLSVADGSTKPDGMTDDPYLSNEEGDDNENPAKRRPVARQVGRISYRDHIYTHLFTRLTGMGLPGIVANQSQTISEAPPWLRVGDDFEMRARVIDYSGSGHSASQKFAAYLRYLGYTSSYETNASQHGNSCAIVAARLTSQLQLTKHLRGDHWLTINTTDAASRVHILEANQLIDTNVAHHNNHYTQFLGSGHIKDLHAHWVVSEAHTHRPLHAGICAVCCSASHATGTCRLPSLWVPAELGVTLDQGYLQVAEITREFFINPRDNEGGHREVFLTQVVNTEDSRSAGYHWFTVALSLRLKPVDLAPMEVV